MTLVDLPSELDDAPPGDALLGLLYGGRGVKRLDVGVYETHYAFNLELKGRGLLVSEYPFDAYMDLATPDERVKAYVAAVNDKTLPSESYGVCDSWEQVIQKWPLLPTMDRNLVLAVSPVVRAEEPSDGGWRCTSGVSTSAPTRSSTSTSTTRRASTSSTATTCTRCESLSRSPG